MQREVNAVRWDPSGMLLASCSDDLSAKVLTWNVFVTVNNIMNLERCYYMFLKIVNDYNICDHPGERSLQKDCCW